MRALARPATPDAGGVGPVAASFVLLGMFWGVWAVATADVERFLGLSHRGFGALLSAAVAGGVVASAVAGPITHHVGTTFALAGTLVVWALGGGAVASRFTPLAFEVSLVTAIAVGAALDVVMNVAAAAALADRPGALVRFHAWYNGGALLGASVTGVVVSAGGSWRTAWFAVMAGALPVAAWVAVRPLPRRPDAGEGGPSLLRALASLRSPWLVRLAVVFACGAMAEGGLDSWGVLFLRSRLAVGALVGAGAYAAGQLLATGARVSLGPSFGRRHGAAGARLGAAVAAVGLAAEAASPVPAVAAVGLAVAAVGISLCWPLLIAAASQEADHPALAVGAVTGAGYLGFLIGPTLVGWVAGSWGLRAGLTVLVAAALVTAATPIRPERLGRRPSS